MNIPFLLTALLFQYPLMILFPILLGWWIRRRFGVSWSIYFIGAATFILSQIVHLPLNWALGLLGGGRGVALWPLLPMALVAGLSAGVCEEGARWLVLRFWAKKVRSWAPGLQFGAGHGGAEAIIFGLLAAMSLIQALVLRSLDLEAMNLPGASADQIRTALAQYWQTPWYMAALAGLERVFAITMQVALASLVVRSVVWGQAGKPIAAIGWLLAAIGVHTLLDFWAVWGIRTLGIWPMYGGLLVLAAGAFWLILLLRKGPVTPAEEPLPAAAPPATAADLTPRALSSEELAQRADVSRYE